MMPMQRSIFVALGAICCGYAITSENVDSPTGLKIRATSKQQQQQREYMSPDLVVQAPPMLKTLAKTNVLARKSKQAPTTTPDPFAKGATAADMSGVSTNAAGDLGIFLTGLFTNSAVLCVFLLIFSVLRQQIPMVYAGRVVTNSDVPFKPSDSFFGWVTASFSLTTKDMIDNCGLDQAMVIEFANFGMKLLAFLGLPLLCVMGPIHCFYGGNRSGDDKLSKLGMANVVDDHPWLYWVHSLLVWFVVVTVQRFIYAAQGNFLKLRKDWLKAMPAPRSTTVLVQNIPEEHCTDKGVATYFNNVFERTVVEKVHVVRKTEALLKLTKTKDVDDLKLDEALHKEKTTGQRPTFRDYTGSSVDAIDYWTEQSKEAAKGIKEEKKRIQALEYKGDPEVLTETAFVTFKNRRDSEMALKVTYTADDDEFVCEIPPDPADVIYTDFQKDPVHAKVMTVVGYGLIAGVFWAYMPAVIGVAYITNLDVLANEFPVFQSLAESPGTVTMWNAMMGSLALQLFISFVPTFFVIIFSLCFVLKAQAWLQQRIQNWYFWFQVMYVLLVTAVGSSVIATIDEILESPTYVFYLLATTMPFATHFYLNFIPLQWVTHAQNMLRTVQCGKFFVFRHLYGEDMAKTMSEPEDQDYYGIGSRSARHSFILALVLVYCSLTPLINALGFMNFFICRLVYGYLIAFAEIRKPDLGGVFWVTNLMNVQRCMSIYIVLMTGVLCFRFSNYWPCIISATSGIYWYWSFSRFQGAFRWESLAFEDIIDAANVTKKHTEKKAYMQNELVDA